MREITLKPGKSILIREAAKADAGKMIRYVKRVADETNFLTFSSDEFNKTVADEEDIVESYKNAANQIFLLAIMGEGVVGMLNVGTSHKRRLRHAGEFGISVLKEHWGKGIGAALIEYMIDWAKDTGIIRKLNLKVQANNKSAIHLYKKYGFEIEGVEKRAFYIDGEFIDDYLMGLLID